KVRPGAVATIVYKPRVHDFKPPTAVEDGAAAATLIGLAGRVAIGEGDVLDGHRRGGLILTVRRGPALLRIAGVQVEDPALTGAAQRDQPAAVQHQLGVLVDDLGGGGHGDRDRIRAAVEGDDPAGLHRRDDGAAGAAGRRSVPDDVVRVADINGPGGRRDGGVALRVSGFQRAARVR